MVNKAVKSYCKFDFVADKAELSNKEINNWR